MMVTMHPERGEPMSSVRVQRRLAAIVAADVAGYSRLMGRDEEGTLAAMNAHLRDCVHPTVAEHGGRIVKTTGDGLLIEFPSIVDAVRCCVGVQQAMAERNQSVPAAIRVQFRIGVNLGDVVSEGDDIFGDGVNIAARLEGIAEPGGICISRVVLDQLRHKLELEVEDLGARALKNIEEPVHAYRVATAMTPATPTSQESRIIAPASRAVPIRPMRPSLAILPFRNVSGDHETDFIADGIGLGIQTLLVQLSGLFFINACAHQAYLEGKATAEQAGEELSVRYVLEGAVQRFGARVRVTAQLTDLHDKAVVWADRYDGDLEDVFALQDDITREVVTSLSSEILGLGTNLDRIWTRSLTAPGAWEYFLRGVSHYYKFTPKDNALAREMFEKLHALHPEKSTGPSYIALTHWNDATRRWVDAPAQSMRLASEWAARSLEPESDNNGLGHAILGSVRVLEGKHEEGLALCRKSIAFRANCPFAFGQLAFAQTYFGDAPAAVKSAREALSVRMVYPPPLVNILAIAHRDSGEIPLSIPAAQEAWRLAPAHVDALVTLCSDYSLTEEGDKARNVAGQIIALDPEFRVASFVSTQPYRETAKLDRLSNALTAAGLPP
jgi:class 3 adenylate cyclase